jgi:large subunit ribosomal protein L13
MKTFVPNFKTIERKWHVIDAASLNVGRLATEVANILRGKNKTIFTPSQDTGDYVIIINCDQTKFAGQKMDTKLYRKHTGYLGHLREATARQVHTKNPTKILFQAIAGMIPRNRLKKDILDKLHLYAGSEHPHVGQQPETLTF